jgi:hypothetical protein
MTEFSCHTRRAPLDTSPHACATLLNDWRSSAISGAKLNRLLPLDDARAEQEDASERQRASMIAPTESPALPMPIAHAGA